MKANMFSYALFKGTIKKVLLKHYESEYTSEIMSKPKETYKELDRKRLALKKEHI